MPPHMMPAHMMAHMMMMARMGTHQPPPHMPHGMQPMPMPLTSPLAAKGGGGGGAAAAAAAADPPPPTISQEEEEEKVRQKEWAAKIEADKQELNRRKKEFKNLLLEKGVTPGGVWEKELPKFIYDKRSEQVRTLLALLVQQYKY